MNIQIMKTYKESFGNVRSHKMEWIRVAYAPILIWALGALSLALIYAAGGHSFASLLEAPATEATPPLLMFGHIVYHIASFIAIFSLYINGYRYAILKEGGQSWITLNLNIRFVKMVLYSILIGILSVIYAAISAGILIGAHALFQSVALNVVLDILLAICTFYLVFRIVLYPVAIAIDQSGALKTSWRLMKGNIWRFIGLFILISISILIIWIIPAIILGIITAILAFGGTALAWFSLIFWIPYAIFMVLLSWAVYSKAMGLVYQELSKK